MILQNSAFHELHWIFDYNLYLPYNTEFYILLGVQLCFRRFPIDGFSGKW